MQIPTAMPHPAKSKIKESGLFLWQVSRMLNVSESYLCRMLNGILPMSEKVESGLRQILSEIEQQQAAQSATAHK